jgi:ACS family pantothenate transporter-like MFS transporter
MTMPIAVYGFLMFPDTPHTVKSWWLSEDERQRCRRRIPYQDHYVVTWQRFRDSIRTTVKTWRFYLFSALFMLSSLSFEKTGVYAEFG